MHFIRNYILQKEKRYRNLKNKEIYSRLFKQERGILDGKKINGSRIGQKRKNE